jgi:hypothetical protein
MNPSGQVQANSNQLSAQWSSAHYSKQQQVPKDYETQQSVPDKTKRQSPGPHGESTGIWKEFSAGMDMLQKYFTHTQADMTAIAASNIRLLHNNLQTTSSYRSIIKTAGSHQDEESMLTHWPLINGSKLYASILCLNDSDTDPLHRNLASHICYDYFNSEDDLGSEAQVLSLFLILEGKLSITRTRDTKSPPVKVSFLSRKHTNHTNKTCFRSGDVLFNPHQQGDISSIHSQQKNTLLLGVHLAFSRNTEKVL